MSQRSSRVVELLQQLIRVASPNPPGDCRAIADFCEAFLQRAGFDTVKTAPDGRAWSVIGQAGDDDGPAIMYHAHIDTVPLGQNARWQHAPFAGEVDGPRVYGLGSVDDKAPLAAMLQAGADALEQGPIHGRLVIVCAADEEVGGVLGTKWLAENSYLPECDFIVVGEQTHNRVATANKGVLRATFHVEGRTAHATNPWRGRNAIHGMAHLILALEAYQEELSRHPHPLLGPPSINAGVIAGGVSANVVPDACLLQVDRRMVPEEDPEIVKHELVEIASALQERDPERRYRVDGFQVSNWFQSALGSSLAQRFLDIASDVTGAPREPIGYLPGSDAKHLVTLARRGMVVFGPGSYEVAHSTDEYVDIGELHDTYEILKRFIAAMLMETRAPAKNLADPAV